MDRDSRDSRRTVVVSGVPDTLPPGRMADKLTIHFQRPRRSRGGDVEEVKYPTNMAGVAFVTFVKAEDAERVVKKEQQIMTDSQFPEDYVLTVFPFSTDVFFYVPHATVDLSIFGSNQESLIESLRSAHRSLRFRPMLQERKASIEGPFAAVQALREDLIHRASQLQSAASAKNAAIKLRKTPPNPGVISHHKYVGPVSRSDSKSEPASGLSTALQSTGEKSKAQSLLSKAKTQNVSSRQKVSHESLAGGRIWPTGSDEEEEKPRVWSRLEMSSEYRAEQRKAHLRQVVGEEIKAGITSSLSGLPQAEEISTKKLHNDNVSQKHAESDGISATKTRGGSSLGSQHSGTSCVKDMSASAVRTKLLQTGLKAVLKTSAKYTEGTEAARAVRLENQESIWTDSYTFKYIEKFLKENLDTCLEGAHMSVKCFEESNLMRISLTERQTSKAASGLRRAIEELQTLLEFWQSALRVHEIFYEEGEPLNKYLLAVYCDGANLMFKDVLYILEESCVKIIGPPDSSLQFYKRVKDKMTQLKDSLSDHKLMQFNR